MDEISVKNLEVFCHHGVYKEENVLGQKFMYLSQRMKEGCQRRF